VRIGNTNAGGGPLCFICSVTAGYELYKGQSENKFTLHIWGCLF
jgi:hypothetical protein